MPRFQVMRSSFEPDHTLAVTMYDALRDDPSLDQVCHFLWR
jgi:hypothetical protein